MELQIGNVIKTTTGLHVITHITGGIITGTETLEDYVVKSALVKEDGEWLTIKEVIEKRCETYLYMHYVDILK